MRQAGRHIMYKKKLIAFIMACCASSQVIAGNIEAGRQKSMVCAACHAVDGNSPIPMYPKLAGQSKTYLQKQLLDYRASMRTGGQEGRNNPIMGALVVALSDEDIDDIASYFSSQALKPSISSAQDTPLYKKQYASGKSLYRGGDTERKIAACTSCHGWEGNGIKTAGFPQLSGQNALYIKDQLKAFRTHQRQNDMNHMMRSTAHKLTDADIESLVVYIASLKVSSLK